MGSTSSQIWGVVLGILVAVPLGIALLVYLVVPACKGIGWFLRQAFSFIFGELGDMLRAFGSILTSLVLVPLTVANVIIGRWSGASHYGRAIQAEFAAIAGCLYRIAIGHPAKLLCLSALTEGIERRIPQVVAAAPGSDRPQGRAGQFDGYSIVGSLAGGGSGGKLYIANPSPEKRAAFARAGIGEVAQVVIKCFSLRDGSSLPQIVRENRALPAAKRLGLILEHELTDERFYYAMRYVPGESLGLVTQRLHAESGAEGLANGQLREAIEYAADIARTLCHYHDGGLWHKDVKPDNIIVSNSQAHLVDFGLITPLRSSMTLTTHGTEYFRDPEMVRMALRGVKVHEVDGAKFDIYATGAVLYSMVENSFPAHGGLSQITLKCPEAIRWIVRRAMTDYDKRYESAAAMLADLEAVASVPDPYAVKPAMLPSFREGMGEVVPGGQAREWEAALPAAAITVGASGRSPASRGEERFAPVQSKNVRVTNWWTGRYAIEPRTPVQSSPMKRSERVHGATAAEQLARARARARTARSRVHRRMKRYSPDAFSSLNAGVGVAVLAFLVLVGGVVFLLGIVGGGQRAVTVTQHGDDGNDRTVHIGPDGVHIESGIIRARDASVMNVERDEGATSNERPFAAIEAHARGEVMVLRDDGGYPKEAKEEVDQRLGRLGEVGFKLRGSTLDAEEGELSGALGGAADLELVADLRNEIGITGFGNKESAERLRRWMDRHPSIQMVVWVGRAETVELDTWILGRRGLDVELMNLAAEAVRVEQVRK